MIWIVLGSIPLVLFLAAITWAMAMDLGVAGAALVWAVTALMTAAALAFCHGISQVAP